MEKLTNFYKNKKILVTGATGFKGSLLCFWLTKLGAKVHGTGFRKYKNKNLLNSDCSGFVARNSYAIV